MSKATKAATHTAGPWTYRETTANYKAGFHIEGPGGGALVYGASESNARLIAAAPEMLEALETVLGLSRGTSGRIIIDRYEEEPIRAAIKKAKGGQ